MAEKTTYEVIIIGGSYAGLSAALALGRSLRQTLVIDCGEPCNRQTPYSHNFLTHDGQPPHNIIQLARQEVVAYPTVHFHQGIAGACGRKGAIYEISTQTGKTFKGKKLIFATGVNDDLPDIEGFAACWGISVLHCPYCHGYEYQNQKTAILANGEAAVHIASLVNNLTNDLTILTNGEPEFEPRQLNTLAAHHITIEAREIRKIVHSKGQIEKVVFADGGEMNLTAMYASVNFSQNTAIPMELGCTLTEHGHLLVDDLQQTSIPGIYACGDNTTSMRSIAHAVAGGNMAGGAVNNELTMESF